MFSRMNRLILCFIVSIWFTIEIPGCCERNAVAGQEMEPKQLAKAGEQVIHWMDVNIRQQDSREHRYHIYLYFGGEVDKAGLESDWDMGDLWSKQALGSVAIDENGRPAVDPETIGLIFYTALNICQLRRPQELQQANMLRRVIDPKDVMRVKLDRDSNLIMLFESIRDRATKSLQTGSYEGGIYRDAFVQTIPYVNEATVNSAALFTAMSQSDETRNLMSGHWNPNLTAMANALISYVEGSKQNWDEKSMQCISELQDPNWQKMLRVTNGIGTIHQAVKLKNALTRAYIERRSLDLNEPTLRVVSNRLSGLQSPMGEGLDMAMSDVRSAHVKLIDAATVVGAERLWSRSISRGETAVVDRLVSLLGSEGLDTVTTRFIFSTGTMVGLEEARKAFDTAGVARSLRLCAASADIEQATRKSYNGYLDKAKDWERLKPPTFEEVDTQVWLHRLQLGAGATFCLVLANIYSNMENLQAAIEYLDYEGYTFSEGIQVSFNANHIYYVSSLVRFSNSLQRNATCVVPEWEDSTKLFDHLIETYRVRPSEIIITVSETATNQGGNLIISDSSEGAIIAWTDTRSDAEGDIYLQRLGAAGNFLWSPNGVPICTAQGRQEAFYVLSNRYIASDGKGGVIVTWEDNRGRDADIYAQRVDANGDVLWITDGIDVCTAAGVQSFPQIVGDGEGGAIITWHDLRDRNKADVFAQRVDSKGRVLWPEDGISLCAAMGWRRRPQIVSDGTGGAIIAWLDGRNAGKLGTAAVTDIYVQRVDASGRLVWPANGVPVVYTQNIAETLYYTLISDGLGGAIVVWPYRNPLQDRGIGFSLLDKKIRDSLADRKDVIGPTEGIYAQRLNPSGDTLWGRGGVLVSAAGEAMPSSLVGDGSGGAIISWTCYRRSRSVENAYLYAQRIDANGRLLWLAGGIPVCQSEGTQALSGMVSDGKGGVIIVWGDSRWKKAGDNWDIYAQRLDADGNILWAYDGLPICTAIGEERYTCMTADNAGGAIITWQNEIRDRNLRHRHNRIYASFTKFVLRPETYKEALVAEVPLTKPRKTKSSKEDDMKASQADLVDVVNDSNIVSAIYENAKAMNNKDIKAYMETIHEDCPIRKQAEESTKAFFEQYDIKSTIKSAEIIESSDQTVSVRVILVTKCVGRRPPLYTDNQTTVVHTLKRSGEKWKIYNTVIISSTPLR